MSLAAAVGTLEGRSTAKTPATVVAGPPASISSRSQSLRPERRSVSSASRCAFRTTAHSGSSEMRPHAGHAEAEHLEGQRRIRGGGSMLAVADIVVLNESVTGAACGSLPALEVPGGAINNGPDSTCSMRSASLAGQRATTPHRGGARAGSQRGWRQGAPSAVDLRSQEMAKLSSGRLQMRCRMPGASPQARGLCECRYRLAWSAESGFAGTGPRVSLKGPGGCSSSTGLFLRPTPHLSSHCTLCLRASSCAWV
jgi:hypothetical protein